MRTDARRQEALERVGTRIGGKWSLDEMLGFGGCASVYAATHRNGARAAVKLLHPNVMSDDILRTRFTREGYVANKVKHPGVVAVLDDDVTEQGVPYLVMELLEGRSLERPLSGDKRMPIPEMVRVADAVLDVLVNAHAAGIVHRDLKPANIFVTKSGQVKVLDFGIARLAEATLDPDMTGATQTGMMMGTATYMPPEQARARWNEVDGRSDLFALGMTMLALVLGRRPRQGDTANEDFLLAMTAPMAPASTLVPELPKALADVIDRACAFRREDRWPDAATMQAALRDAMRPASAPIIITPPAAMSSATDMDAFGGSTTRAAFAPGSMQPPRSSGSGTMAFLIVAAVFAITGLALGGMYWRTRRAPPPPEVSAVAPPPAVTTIAMPTSAPVPAPVPAPAESVQTAPEPAPAPSVMPSPVTATATATAPAKRPARPSPKPASSANFYDERF